jgi:hypothetical protein
MKLLCSLRPPGDNAALCCRACPALYCRHGVPWGGGCMACVSWSCPVRHILCLSRRIALNTIVGQRCCMLSKKMLKGPSHTILLPAPLYVVQGTAFSTLIQQNPAAAESCFAQTIADLQRMAGAAPGLAGGAAAGNAQGGPSPAHCACTCMLTS